MKTYKTRPFSRDGSPAQEAALELQLRTLRSLEATELYQDLCAAADARRRAEEALPRQQNGKLLARASAPAAGLESPSAGGNRPAASGAAQGRSPGSAAVQAPPTSEAAT